MVKLFLRNIERKIFLLHLSDQHKVYLLISIDVLFTITS